jgi:hypothetical protein
VTPEDEMALELMTVKLPDWIPVPKSLPHRNIAYSPEKGIYVMETGDQYDSLVQAEQALTSRPQRYDIFFDESLVEAKLGIHFLGDRSCFVTARGAGLINMTTGAREMLMKGHYHTFLELDALYHQDPDDWVAAYTWLKHHPAFYHYPRYTDIDDPDSDIIMQNGLRWLSVAVWRSEETDQPIVMFEHGATTGENSSLAQPSHDIRLDTYASTFEDAYLDLARSVDRLYGIDGLERNNE